MTANTYGRQVVVPLTNKSGGSVAAGDVVVVDTANNDAFTTSTAGAVTGTVGIAQETIASNAIGRVLLSGYAALINTSASVTRGNFGKTHTVAKQAVDAGAARVAGTFCQFLTGGTTPDAVVWPTDLGAAGSSAPLAVLRYQPAGANSQAITSTTLVDVTAGAAITFTAPASGNVLVDVEAFVSAPAFSDSILLGLRESTTIVAGPERVLLSETSQPTILRVSVSFYLTGLSAGSHTYKLAACVTGGTGNVYWGATAPASTISMTVRAA